MKRVASIGLHILLKANRLIASALFLLLLASPARSSGASEPAADVHSIASAVDNHYNHLRSLEAEFTEIYRGNGVDRTESGTLWLKKPRKMRWEYRSPREKLFLTDGQNAWLYLPDERQARKEPFKNLEDLRSPLGFLLGKTKLENELQGLSLAPDAAPIRPGDRVLRGVPKALAGRVSQIRLEITPDSRIARIEIEEVDGGITEYRFEQQKENVPVEDARFRFSPPAGIETIEGDLGQ